uniref:IP07534p n=1 Tax=Drosophila melanogaster TaxID=7227 RepID=Q1EC21_DROME|nr:IP07534p [Drosophila melanogaster]
MELLNESAPNPLAKTPKSGMSTGGKILIAATGGVGIGLSIVCAPLWRLHSGGFACLMCQRRPSKYRTFSASCPRIRPENCWTLDPATDGL